MEADLRSFTSSNVSASPSASPAVFFAGVTVEVAIAQTFAEAACLASSSMANGEPVTVAFTFPACVGAHLQQGKEQLPQPQQVCWTRESRDACRRCVDRALTRVYPPIDPLCYLGPSSLAFGETDLTLRVQLRMPSAANTNPSSTALAPVEYRVEGSRPALGSDGSELSFLRRLSPSSSSHVSGSGISVHNRGCGPLSSTAAETTVTAAEAAQNAADEDLWRRARATRSDAAFLDAVAGPVMGATSAVAAAAERNRRIVLVRRLSRHATERLVNEASWAGPLPAPTSSSGAPTGGSGHRRLSMPACAPLFTRMLPGKRFNSIVEATAATAGRRRGQDVRGLAESQGEASSTRTSRHGLVHLDVRGIEFTAWVVAHTGRYAYVACPAGNAEELVLITRVPLPSWLASSTTGSDIAASAAENSNHHAECAKNLQKRLRGADATVTARLAATYGNYAEATLHDNSGPFVEMPREHWALIDVRAHRALSQPDPHPGRTRLWFEDGYVTARHHTSDAKETETAAASTMREVTQLVEASCTRYLADRSALHALWGEMQVEEREDLARRRRAQQRHRQQELQFEQQQQQQQQQREETEEGVADRTSVLSDGASAASTSASVRAVVDPPSNTQGTDADDDDDGDGEEVRLARQHRQFSLRLFRAFDTLLKAMSDPSAVAFGMARARPATTATASAAGISLLSLPTARTCGDIQRLEEGPMVEFKYALGSGPAATTDAQRLRNTMAAMAGTLGGVICVGVSDSGVAVGQPQGHVRAALRISGFCPAMATSAVTLRDVRVLVGDSESNVRGSENGSAAARMPKDWWKAPQPSALAVGETAGSPAGKALTMARTRATAESTARVVTVVSIAKGSAPFYASGRTALPYVRGCASTTPMPARVMWERVHAELSASAM